MASSELEGESTSAEDPTEFNAVAIAAVKEALSNSDPEIQLEAVRSVLDTLRECSEEKMGLLDIFVASEILDPLLDIISCLNVPLVCSTFSLLDELILSRLFVSDARASLIVKSILRSVQVFCDFAEGGFVVLPGLDIVSKIIITLVQSGKQLNTFCDLDQLIKVGQTVLKSADGEMSILRSVSQIVYTVLLRSDALIRHHSVEEFGFPHLVAELLNLLCRATHASPHIDIDTAICEVGAACMCSFLKASDPQKHALESLHSLIRTAMTKLIAPHVADWIAQADGNNLDDLLTLVKGIMSLYHYPDPIEKLNYTKLLVEANFLFLLPTMEFHCRTWMHYMVVRSLLVEMLVCLSSHELGQHDWEAIIVEAMKILPERATLFRLEAHGFQQPICTTLIVYNYFILSAVDCPEIDCDFFKDICIYINLIKTPPSPPLFKALWFCFCIGALTSDSSYLIRKTRNMVLKLINSYEIKKIYTRHSACLRWVFRTPNAPRDFRIQIMNLWISEESSSNTEELKSLIAQSRNAFNVYLGSLASLCTDENTVSHHLSIFPEVLRLCDDEYIDLVAYDAWSMLPQMLTSSYLKNDIHGITPLLAFCTEFQPKLLDQDLLSRVACMVPGIVANRKAILPTDDGSEWKENPLKYIVTTKFICVLLAKVEEKNEIIVITPFLNHEQFIIALEYSLTLGSQELTIIVMELLSMMLLLQRKYSLPSCRNVEISAAELARLLYGDAGTVQTTVKMLHALLLVQDASIFPSRSILIVQSLEEYLRIIYVRLHMIGSIGTDEVSYWCWVCLKKLLQFSKAHPPLDKHLSCLSYTHDLIKLCATRSMSWDAMMEFVNVWLPYQPPTTDDRSFGKIALDDTLRKIAQSQAAKNF